MSKFKSSIVMGAEVAVFKTFGAMHFFAQSSADLLKEAEAKFMSRNNKYDYHEIKEMRTSETKRKQDKVIALVNKVNARVDKAKAEVKQRYDEAMAKSKTTNTQAS